MRLYQVGEVYGIDSQFSEKDQVKAAGAWWHPGPDCGRKGCKACKAGWGKGWWAPTEEVAARLAQYAVEPLRSHLMGLEQRRQHAISMSRAATAEVDLPRPAGLEYLPFQRAGIAYALARRNTLFGDEMGLGKTIQALGVINADPTIKQVLVICPASLKRNWAREAEKWLTRKFLIQVVEDGHVSAGADFVIVNYERLRNGVNAALMGRQWDALIVDEAHKLKNPEAQRTQVVLGRAAKKGKEAVAGLVERARRRLFLTGTPILNKPIEMWGLVSTLAPETFPSFWGFAKRYCGASNDGGYGWDLSGHDHLDELQEKLRQSCMVRRLKKDVLTELPAKQRQIVELEPPPALRLRIEAENAAWAAHEERLGALQDEVSLAHAAGDQGAYEAAVGRLHEATQQAFSDISRLRHETAMAKVPQVIEHLDDALESEDAVVVFAHHKDVIAALAEHYGKDCVTLTGDTPVEERQRAVDAFQAGKARVFIGSIAAAGVGLTLTAASHVVFAELDWVPANVTQAEDRCHRVGQQDSVLVQHLVVNGSLDARMAHVLVEKQRVADLALDVIVKREPAIPTAAVERPSKYPKASLDQRLAAARCLQVLTALDDDHAAALNGRGFNKADTRLGHSLAAASLRGPLTDGQVWLAAKVLRKYRGQLGDLLAPLTEEKEAAA